MFIVQDNLQCLQAFIGVIYALNQHCVVVEYLKRISLYYQRCVFMNLLWFSLSAAITFPIKKPLTERTM
jgi:hypothetical protein